jgi:NDP-sugar pyrophosphorylase family protein
MSLPALVLTAGLGTRLRPLTYLRAKAAVPVNGEPLAIRVVRWLAAAGHTDLVLNLHHHPETLTRRLGDGHDRGARVRYSWEQPVLGSAGGPRHALPLLADSGQGPFLLVNGDTLTDVDLQALRETHERAGALVTMAVIPNPRPDKYGGVQVSGEGWVTGFTRAGTHEESFHFIGVQVAEPRAFADLPDGVPAESVNALYPTLMIARGRCIAAFVSTASFRDIGTPADCLQTSLELAEIEGDRLTTSHGSQIDPSARLTRTAVWDDVTIGPGAVLTECIVGDGASVPAGARYERCAIVPSVRTDGERTLRKGERLEGQLLVKAL